jgi:hypothetical protein
MMAIFSDLIEKVMEVFMDDFSIYGKTFEDCLANLDEVLKRCQMADLVVGAHKMPISCANISRKCMK